MSPEDFYGTDQGLECTECHEPRDETDTLCASCRAWFVREEI